MTELQSFINEKVSYKVCKLQTANGGKIKASDVYAAADDIRGFVAGYTALKFHAVDVNAVLNLTDEALEDACLNLIHNSFTSLCIDCPKNWFDMVIKGGNGTQSFFSEVGLLVHAIMRRYTNNVFGRKDDAIPLSKMVSEFNKGFETICIICGVHTWDGLYKTYGVKLRTFFQKFQLMGGYDGLKIGNAEEGFAFNYDVKSDVVDSITVSGICDMWYIKNGVLHVRDYRTGKYGEGKSRALVRQGYMSLYHVMTEHADTLRNFDVDIEDAVIEFVFVRDLDENGRPLIITFNYNDDDLNSVMSWVESRAVAQIKTFKEGSFKEAFCKCNCNEHDCHYCYMKNYCIAAKILGMN